MWEPLFDRMIRSLLRHGTLDVTMPSGRRERYGDGTGTPVAIHLHDTAMPRRLIISPEMGLGEGYMDGDLTIEGDDLHGLLALLLSNRADERKVAWLAPQATLRRLGRRLQQFNPAHRARENVAHHYDLSQELYDAFLDADRQYSCAYFPTGTETLEQAQEAKKRHIARKLLLEPGHRVLDIGCGWGGMALTLARDYGARVVGVTLSRDQHRIATERARAEGLDDRVEFRLQDYRKVRDRFDRIVSVGMFEHVGTPHYREFFSTVRERLTEDGVALLHTIGRMRPPGTTSPWILKYIFPGGYIPALSEVMGPVERESLWACDIEVWRLHYAKTLRNWQERFRAAVEDADQRARIPVLRDERFVRMWKFYLVASEMSFRHGGHDVFQIQLARRQDAVPLTRDYLYADARSENAETRSAEAAE